MAGAPGFEPGIMIPKTNALPLGYAPIFSIFDEKAEIVKQIIILYHFLMPKSSLSLLTRSVPANQIICMFMMRIYSRRTQLRPCSQRL